MHESVPPNVHQVQEQAEVQQVILIDAAPPADQTELVTRMTTRERKAPLLVKDSVFLNIHQIEPYAMNKFLTYDKLSSKYQAFIANSSITTESANYNEAIKDIRWVEAM